MTNGVDKVVSWKLTYASRVVVLVGTDRATADKWAVDNARGWKLKSVSAVRGTDNKNFTVTYGKWPR